jgi:hypothetical protein
MTKTIHPNIIQAIKDTRRLAGQARNHDHWLAIMKFGLSVMLNDPAELLTEIVKQADTLAYTADDGSTFEGHIRPLMEELGLRVIREEETS